MQRQKYTYEGSYGSRSGLVLCFRVETGGVPRFENVLIRPGDLRGEEVPDWHRYLAEVMRAQEGPPWEQDPLPGIG